MRKPNVKYSPAAECEGYWRLRPRGMAAEAAGYLWLLTQRDILAAEAAK